MKLRLFVAINLPEKIKELIAAELKEIAPLIKSPVRFLKPDNWHLTLSFLGYQEEKFLDPILRAVRETAGVFPAPTVEFNLLTYGPIDPLGKSLPARMIWITGSPETSETLAAIKKKLEDELVQNTVRFKRENRQFQTHLTLARFEPAGKAALPPIERDFIQEFAASGLDLMKSELRRSGAEYSVLSSFAFKKGQ